MVLSEEEAKKVADDTLLEEELMNLTLAVSKSEDQALKNADATLELTETSAINAALAVSQSDQDARQRFKNSEFEEIKRTAKENIKSAETEMEVSMLFEEDMKMRAQSKHLFFSKFNRVSYSLLCHSSM